MTGPFLYQGDSVSFKPRTRKAKREIAYQRMKAQVQRAEKALKELGYQADSRTHENADGTIDAELRVKPKRGQQVNDVFLDMESVSRPVPRTWVSTGVRYEPRESEEFYVRFRGMSQANANYQRSSRLSLNFVTGRQINTAMQRRGRRKAEQVFLRIHWNESNKQPERKQ